VEHTPTLADKTLKPSEPSSLKLGTGITLESLFLFLHTSNTQFELKTKTAAQHIGGEKKPSLQSFEIRNINHHVIYIFFVHLTRMLFEFEIKKNLGV
jgi:hypothetical protein